MQKFNYHTHTIRCKHAVGTDEEYVLAAIEAGLTTLGFSDHCPYPGHPMHDRMDYEELDEYVESIGKLKEKYADLIDIRIGLECEYFEEFHDYYRALYEKMDYLILAQHYSSIDGIDYWFKCDDQDMKRYADIVIKAMDTGFFKYYAHPDYVMIPRNTYSKSMDLDFRRIFRKAKEKDIVVEINLKGKTLGKKVIDKHLQYIYPNRRVFEAVKEEGCKCVFGLDVHNPEFFVRFYSDIEEIKEVLGGIDLDIIEDLKL